MQFLGMTSGSGTAWPSYTCHGAIADVVASVGLAQPACLRVQTAGEVNSAMDALSLVLQGKMSEADFFARADWTSSSGAGLNSDPGSDGGWEDRVPVGLVLIQKESPTRQTHHPCGDPVCLEGLSRFHGQV